MLSSTKRRMSVLERSIRIPITTDILLARAEERARLKGASFEDALQSLVPSLRDRDLECVAEELMQLALSLIHISMKVQPAALFGISIHSSSSRP